MADSAPAVLHVVPSLAPRYGGPSAATLGMCRALGAAGTRVVVATTDADGPGRLPVPVGEVAPYDGVPVVFFPRVASESFKWSPALARWLAARVGDFDLVHVHAVFSHASVAAGRACRAARKPYLVRPLGTLDPWSLEHHRRRKQVLMLAGARPLLEGAAAVHYTSDEEMRLAEGELPWLRRGTVVPLGVDAAIFEQRRGGSDAPFVLALCRLDPKKGIDLLIDAFHDAVAAGDCRGWSLAIAGDGDADYVASLRRLAEGGPARARITFHGWVSGPARLALLGDAALFALPSHQENFGIAMAEALAAGVPVAVSPGVNLAGAVVAAGAGWVVARDRAAWSRALGRITADRGALGERGANARRFAERFRWTTVAEALVALYGEVRHGVIAACGAGG